MQPRDPRALATLPLKPDRERLVSSTRERSYSSFRFLRYAFRHVEDLFPAGIVSAHSFDEIVAKLPQLRTQLMRVVFDIDKALSLLFHKNFLLLDRRDGRVLTVFPEGNEEAFHSHGAWNLDVFVIESDDVAHIHSVGVSTAEQLKPSRKCDLVFRIRSLERRPVFHQTLLEDHAGNCLHFARQLCADAEARDFGKLGYDLFDSFHRQIACEIRAQSGQAVRREEA